jgi:hypothetical protein
VECVYCAVCTQSLLKSGTQEHYKALKSLFAALRYNTSTHNVPFAYWTMHCLKVNEKTNKCTNPSMYWHSIVISWPRHLLQYTSTASIHLWFLQHWATISTGSWLIPWCWHFKVPKHVGECQVSIHWRINAFVGLFRSQCSVTPMRRTDIFASI